VTPLIAFVLGLLGLLAGAVVRLMSTHGGEKGIGRPRQDYDPTAKIVFRNVPSSIVVIQVVF
jgi:hypothetical protein